MTLNFMKYPSLVNHYAIGKEHCIANKLDELWYSTEKIHVANASIVINRNGEQGLAKRTSLITDDDKQFSALKLVIPDTVYESIAKIFEYHPSIDYLNVYGEYFGNGVQSMDYEVNKNKNKSFKVFNVLVHLIGFPATSRYVFGYEKLIYFFERDDLVPIEDIKPLREFLKQEPDDKSYLGGNREGNVYQPINGYEINTHDGLKFIGVKHKLASFSEKQKNNNKPNRTKEIFSIEELEIRTELGEYITINRVKNVLSHGEYDLVPKNIGKIMLAVKEDAICEYTRETTREVNESAISLKKLVEGYSSQIAKMIKELIRESECE
ncbi:RNA ligase family protein [Enterococcus wangshanyuanii]|uniref:RNA ligase domain-containing protein n=1 Tax=Enterococcus wangshanyuanii TaxID=2005703 RepID=A0ABQ1NF22_9ENTE|nr:RNA ligase family protein [Enterococcus wangshanyuanii]GGC74741.1 hypothetical protein GCM10011573_00320 [Enterococcus wangshanyuanii]